MFKKILSLPTQFLLKRLFWFLFLSIFLLKTLTGYYSIHAHLSCLAVLPDLYNDDNLLSFWNTLIQGAFLLIFYYFLQRLFNLKNNLEWCKQHNFLPKNWVYYELILILTFSSALIISNTFLKISLLIVVAFITIKEYLLYKKSDYQNGLYIIYEAQNNFWLILIPLTYILGSYSGKFFIDLIKMASKIYCP